MANILELDRATELPLTTLPDIPSFSENYCFDGFDAKADAGIWLHLGRWPRNPMLWREQILLYLPDGDYAVIRAFGDQSADNGPRGPLMRFECEEAGKRWRLVYDGPARRLSLDSMMAGPATHLSEGPFILVGFDLVFDAVKPAWELGRMDNENWATFHYEQHGRLTGTIRYDLGDGLQTIAIDGQGYRDHSRGPRELSNFGGFYWNHGFFPDGRGFSAVHSFKVAADGSHEPGVASAVVFDGDRMLPATLSGLPLLTDKGVPPESYEIVISSELGEMRIAARLLRTIAQSADRHMDQYDGIGGADIAKLYCFEQPTEYRWGDQVAIGWTERAKQA